MLSEGGLGVPLEPLVLALFGSTAPISQLLSPPCSSAFAQRELSPGEWGHWAGMGHRPTHPVPPPWPTFMAGLALQTPPNTTRTLMGLVPPPSSSLGGDKSPGQPELSQGILSHLCPFVPGERSQCPPRV